jgi:hypothetical protein
LDNNSFNNAFNDFVEKRIHEALTNNADLKMKGLLDALEGELLDLIPSENERDKLKEVFFKILSEQNQICYELGLADSRFFSLKLTK